MGYRGTMVYLLSPATLPSPSDNSPCRLWCDGQFRLFPSCGAVPRASNRAIPPLVPVLLEDRSSKTQTTIRAKNFSLESIFVKVHIPSYHTLRAFAWLSFFFDWRETERDDRRCALGIKLLHRVGRLCTRGDGRARVDERSERRVWRITAKFVDGWICVR